jgi:hypothetical protein
LVTGVGKSSVAHLREQGKGTNDNVPEVGLLQRPMGPQEGHLNAPLDKMFIMAVEKIGQSGDGVGSFSHDPIVPDPSVNSISVLCISRTVADAVQISATVTGFEWSQSCCHVTFSLLQMPLSRKERKHSGAKL